MSSASHTKNPIPTAGATFLTVLQDFLREEDADRYVNGFYDFVFSGGIHATGAGLTKSLGTFVAYASGKLILDTASVAYTDAETTWVIASTALTGDLGTFTRVSGTHYLIDFSSVSKPALPSGAIWLMEVTTSGGAVTVVTDLRNRVPAVGVFDNLASFPAASRRGLFAYARDTNLLYIDSGSTWIGLTDNPEVEAARDGEASLSARLDDFEVLAKLTNRTGSSLAANDVVAIDPANNEAVTFGSTQGAPRPYVVAHEVIADTNLGRFRTKGHFTIKVQGVVTRGNYLVKSATAAAAEDSLSPVDQGPPYGALGIALTAAAGPGVGTVRAEWWGVPAMTAPTGAEMPWSLPEADVPAGWLLEYGQAVSRTTYARLNARYSAAGYPYGSGDGSTTFNLVDKRGRQTIARDNMGGVSANRVTDAAADTLGGTGGSEALPAHAHDLNAHTHILVHTHTMDDDGWGTDGGLSNVSGRLLTSNGGGAALPTDVTLALNSAVVSSGASATTTSGPTPVNSGNPTTSPSVEDPYIAANWIVKV